MCAHSPRQCGHSGMDASTFERPDGAVIEVVKTSGYYMYHDGEKENTGAACASFGKGSQAENDDPQPQVLVAFGFMTTNCAPFRSSR